MGWDLACGAQALGECHPPSIIMNRIVPLVKSTLTPQEMCSVSHFTGFSTGGNLGQPEDKVSDNTDSDSEKNIPLSMLLMLGRKSQ